MSNPVLGLEEADSFDQGKALSGTTLLPMRDGDGWWLEKKAPYQEKK